MKFLGSITAPTDPRVASITRPFALLIAISRDHVLNEAIHTHNGIITGGRFFAVALVATFVCPVKIAAFRVHIRRRHETMRSTIGIVSYLSAAKRAWRRNPRIISRLRLMGIVKPAVE